MKLEPIAVVGLGGLFPDAPTLDRFWDNVEAGRCAARRPPPGRWILPDVEALSPERGAPDRAYSLNACFLEEIPFDPSGLDVDAALVSRLDPLFALALTVARGAWLSARVEALDRRRVGVAIGNIVLPTDSSSALTRELLGPAFEAQALDRVGSGRAAERTHPLNRCVAGLPAGLIARALGLGGGAFTLDAACASSLYAVKLAVDELRSGRADAMIAGGVSRPESLYAQIGFSQLRALSARGRPAPFDAGADGLVVGEGAGLLVLKRLADAWRDGDRVRATIHGIGLSNDVGGSLLAPNTVGQLRAMRQAYEQAGWAPTDVDHLECHATGTPMGDPVEVASLKTLWGDGGWRRGQCALGSVKSNVGHLLTAAGAAGMAKTILSFERKRLAPTANFEKPSPALGLDGSPFRVLKTAEDWARPAHRPRRAAVSAFGFGGINAHVLLEEPGPRPARVSTRVARAPAPEPLAIVGMDARFGPLDGLRAFQEAALAGSAPEPTTPRERWWGLPTSADFRGHFVPEASVAEGAYRVPPKELEEALPQQTLLLEAAARALADARLPEAGRDRVGVFVGLGLDLNATNFHLRWSLALRAQQWARERGWTLDDAQRAAWLAALRGAAGPALSANRTMGALGGIVASRVAREFRIGGPSFTLSSEESSALRALETAARLLRQKEIDAALIGAVDLCGDARAALLSGPRRPMRSDGRGSPFDAEGGAAVGEGAAAVVLKRLSDAQRDGDRVYAALKGIGSASGGFDDAERLACACAEAMRRACGEAGVDPSTIGYLEANGSGFPDEDSAEARAIAEVYGTATPSAPCALASVKAVVGHAGAAAGLAALTRAALALYQEILPPFHVERPIPQLEALRKRLHLPLRPQYWLRNRAEGPRRAAVTAIGVDGSCGHAVLEAVERMMEPAQVTLERRQPLGARDEALFAAEADDAARLLSALDELRAWALQQGDGNAERLARLWLARSPQEPKRALACAVVARGARELAELVEQAQESIRENPERPIAGDRIHFSFRPAFGPGRLAFVFPGSGNQYLGMGCGLWTQWPEVLRALDRENGYLRDQMAPDLLVPWRFDWPSDWAREAEARAAADYKSMIFGSVAHGAALSDLVRSFAVAPDAVIGYSLGETAGLFALRAWKDRDEMLRRIGESSLFVSDLAGPCDAARRFWNLPTDERVDWVLGVIDRPAESVRSALKGMERAALLIVNAPLECVVGGYRKAIDSLVEGLGCVFLPLQGVSTVHFPAAQLVAQKYRELHLLPTTTPEGVRFYSAASARVYEVTRGSAADSIVEQAVRSFDFSALIRQAHEDGLRLFVELGPQASCTRMIGKILGPLPHMAKSACARGQDDVSTVLRLLAALIAERVAVDLRALYARPTLCVGHRDPEPARLRVISSLGGRPFGRVEWRPAFGRDAAGASGVQEMAAGAGPAERVLAAGPAAAQPPPAFQQGAAASPDFATAFFAARAAAAQAHEAFLSLSSRLIAAQARLLASPAVTAAALSSNQPKASPDGLRDGAPLAIGLPAPVPRALNREQCLKFAVGRIGDVLGPRFSHVEAFPTRVRLPDEPLMLVDRVLEVEGEPNSLGSGRVVTEHDVRPDAWYLDAGRIPTCVAVEAGQADLLLSGFLGIDSRTRGLAVYRLLDAEVTFHAPLPAAGEVIRYDIRIERFARHADAWLFFFDFDGTVRGRPLISMRKGCAGFFTDEALAAGRGIVAASGRALRPGRRPSDWKDLAPLEATESYSDERTQALREGRLADAFGAAFARLALARPAGLPGGRMRLLDRIVELSPRGGRYGLGLVRAESDIRPDDWHLVCHFKDDPVMPGTLMYECCLHALRVFLMRLGWVGEEGEVWNEPVAGVASSLKCRGQVLPSTRKAAYEIHVKELGYEEGSQAPFAIADALMFSDGKPIVEITDMSLRMGGIDRARLEALWRADAGPLFDRDKILAFAVGKPSEAFGQPYRAFDAERVIARLPGPPYQFLDRITRLEGCRPFVLAPGARAAAEYDVPSREWYFDDHGQPTMPFSVLLEVALQPCGWLAAYLGSALTSPVDLSFRNLGGTATLHREVAPDEGALTTTVTMTKVAQSSGMIIQDFDFFVRSARGLVYEGTTQFGFFTRQALAQQVGIQGARPYEPSAPGRMIEPAGAPGMPRGRLQLLDRAEAALEGGPKGLGFARGWRAVDPSEWFFKAHFHQDPVCPGSLGLESFIQLMKVYARQRWGASPPLAAARPGRFESLALGRRHCWLYRGQYTPVNKQVELSLGVTEADDEQRLLRAEGHLKVDGLTIYHMKDFALRAR